MERLCSRCRFPFEGAKTQWYCHGCRKELNATVYKERTREYRLKNKARELAQKKEYYQRMKKLRGEPVVYRTPRCPILREEPVKPVVFSIVFD